MKIVYDRDVDALYVRVVEEPAQVTTQWLSEHVAANSDPDGEIVGIEILDASEHVFRSPADRTVEVQNLASVTKL